MTKKLYALIYSLVLVVMLVTSGSCGETQSKPPSKHIPEETFINLLTDVRLLEGAYGVRVGRPDTIGKYMDSYYKMVFDKYGISKEQFIFSYEAYLADHERMLLIEDKVLEKLSLMQADLDKRIPAEIKTTKDSLNKEVKDTLNGKTPQSPQSPSKPG